MRATIVCAFALAAFALAAFANPIAGASDPLRFPNGGTFDCYPSTYQGAPASYCQTGFPIRQVVEADYDVQYQSEWCWAASLEMALRLEHHAVSQANIVMAAFGALHNWPATSDTIEDVANSLTTDDAGNSIDVTLRDRVDDDTSDEIHHMNGAFSRGHPLLLALPGHVVMLTAYTFFGDGDQNQDYHFANGRVMDPWPTTYPGSAGGPRVIDRAEFATVQHIWEVYVK